MPTARVAARNPVVTVKGLPALQKRLEALAGFGKVRQTAIVGTDLMEPPYPYFLEYGTSRMPAYATARPAFDERRGEAVKVAGDVIGRLIARAPGSAGYAEYNGYAKAGLEAGGEIIRNGWVERIQQGPVPTHQRRSDSVSNLSDTGTYARSVRVLAVQEGT